MPSVVGILPICATKLADLEFEFAFVWCAAGFPRTRPANGINMHCDSSPQTSHCQFLTVRAFAEMWAGEQKPPKDWKVAAVLLVKEIERGELCVLGDPYGQGEPENCVYKAHNDVLMSVKELIWRFLGGDAEAAMTDELRYELANQTMLPLSAYQAWFGISKRKERPSSAEYVQRHGFKRNTVFRQSLALQNQQAKIDREGRCREWLEAEMRASPNHQPHSKVHFQHKAADDYGVAGRAFRRVWDHAMANETPSGWGLSGRRKKSSH